MKQYLYNNQKDGRSRIVIVDDSGNHTSKSYPRFLIEKELGRELLPNEDVHHKDGDVTNNDIDNLEVILHGEHQKIHSTKYYDTEETCCICGKKFIFTGIQWRGYYSDLKRGKYRNITCSRHCSGVLSSMKHD